MRFHIVSALVFGSLSSHENSIHSKRQFNVDGIEYGYERRQ